MASCSLTVVSLGGETRGCVSCGSEVLHPWRTRSTAMMLTACSIQVFTMCNPLVGCDTTLLS